MTNPSQPVVLHLPADPTLLRVARVAVASVAADLAFTLQDIEDLRVAVDELAAVVIEEAAPGATLVIEIHADPAGIEVVGQVAADGAASLHPVAGDLLAMMAPDYELTYHEGQRRFRFARLVQVQTP